LSKLSSIVDELVIIDNGSTDGTLEAYKKYPKIKNILYTTGYDEGRDKIMLLEEAKKRNPDWIIWIDGDEVFEDHFTREVAENYMNSKYNRITFRMCNFWLSKERCRFDGQYYLYNLHPQRSMWKNVLEAYFRNRKLHNGDIMGIPGKIFISPYRLKHYGYVNRAEMQMKLDRYLENDQSGDRDYVRFIDPNLPSKTYKYLEFKNQIGNYAYILFYKYLCNALWFVERVRLKIFKII
jgi:glycosyltransferase involved in cell wall biosynthesis